MATICPRCRYPVADDSTRFCSKCGYPIPQDRPARPAAAPAPAVRTVPRAARRPVHRRTGGGGFLSFGTLITARYLKLIYILGAVLIVLMSIMGIAGMFGKAVDKGANISISITNTTAIAQNPSSSPLFWIGFLVAGSILWRMFCELFVLVSRGRGAADDDPEAGPEADTEEYGEEDAGESGGDEESRYIECPKCAKIVTAGQLRVCEHCGVEGCSNCIRSMGFLKKSMTCRECFENK